MIVYLYNQLFTFTIKHNGTKTFFTCVFICRNEEFLTTGIVNGSHRTRTIVNGSHRTRTIVLQNCSIQKWNNILFGKSVVVFTILLSNVKTKLVLLLFLSCVSVLKELRLKNSQRVMSHPIVFVQGIK
jgi:hypothetical protein